MRSFVRRHLNNMKIIYYNPKSWVRRIVECVFGILTKRLNVFGNKTLVHPNKAAVISMTQTTCAYHNIFMDN